jgi:Helix-turn-helix domain
MTEPLKKGTRVTGADRAKLAADLKKRYKAGESIRSLADSTGRSYGFVHRILTEAGVRLRGRAPLAPLAGVPRSMTGRGGTPLRPRSRCKSSWLTHQLGPQLRSRCGKCCLRQAWKPFASTSS